MWEVCHVVSKSVKGPAEELDWSLGKRWPVRTVQITKNRPEGGLQRVDRIIHHVPGQHPSPVLPLSVVDNSNFSPNRLTALSTLLILASQGAFSSPHFKQRGFVWSFMCLWSVSFSVWRCFGVLTGFLFGFPPQEEGSSTPQPNVCSSPAAQTIAPPVVSPPLPHRV
jgi:hypothetical protein